MPLPNSPLAKRFPTAVVVISLLALPPFGCGGKAVIDADGSDPPSPVADDCRIHDGVDHGAECCAQTGCHLVPTPERDLLCMSGELLCYSQYNGGEVFEAACPVGYTCAIHSWADAKEVDGCEHDGELDVDFRKSYCVVGAAMSHVARSAARTNASSVSGAPSACRKRKAVVGVAVDDEGAVVHVGVVPMTQRQQEYGRVVATLRDAV